MRRTVLATALLLFLSYHSVASDTECKLDGDRSIALIIQHLDRLEQLLPSVPTEQDRVIAEQQRSVSILGLDARDPAGANKAADDLRGNPYYPLKRVHDALKRARFLVSIVLVDTQSLSADKYIGMGLPHRFFEHEFADTNAVKLDHAGFAIGPLAAMEVAAGEYLSRDQQSAHPKLAPNARGEIESLSSGYAAALGRYMQCKIKDALAILHNIDQTGDKPTHD